MTGPDSQVSPVRDTGREQQMRSLYQAHAQTVYRFLLRRTLGDRDAAEDLLQETMLRAWRKLDTLPADLQALRPWLLTVARNVTIDVARARQARATEINTGDITWVPARGDAFDGVLNKQTLREALLRLSPEHRTVLIELYYRGATVAEVAARTGVPEGTVRSRSYYGLRALRAALGEETAGA